MDTNELQAKVKESISGVVWALPQDAKGLIRDTYVANLAHALLDAIDATFAASQDAQAPVSPATPIWTDSDRVPGIPFMAEAGDHPFDPSALAGATHGATHAVIPYDIEVR